MTIFNNNGDDDDDGNDDDDDNDIVICCRPATLTSVQRSTQVPKFNLHLHSIAHHHHHHSPGR